MRLRARGDDRLRRLLDDGGCHLRFGGQRHDGGGIAQHAAIVGAVAAVILLLIFGQRFRGRGESGFGARLVAEDRQRRTQLRAGQRRAEVADLGVGEIFEIAHRRAAGAGQHVEGIGGVLAFARLHVRRIADAVAQIIQRLGEGAFRHREALLAGPEQEVGHERRKPQVVVLAARRPQAEGAVGTLAVDQLRHAVGQALLDIAVKHAFARLEVR